MTLPNRYPLIAVPGGPQPPRTDLEREAYDEGMAGRPNPYPGDARLAECWEDGLSMARELARETAHMRRCNYDY